MPRVPRKFLGMCPTNSSINEAIGITTAKWKQKWATTGKRGRKFLELVDLTNPMHQKNYVLKTAAPKLDSAWRLRGEKNSLCQKAHPLHPIVLSGLRNNSISISYRDRQYFCFLFPLDNHSTATLLHMHTHLCAHIYTYMLSTANIIICLINMLHLTALHQGQVQTEADFSRTH